MLDPDDPAFPESRSSKKQQVNRHHACHHLPRRNHGRQRFPRTRMMQGVCAMETQRSLAQNGLAHGQDIAVWQLGEQGESIVAGKPGPKGGRTGHAAEKAGELGG